MEHGTLLNVVWQPGWERVWGKMDTCIFMAKSLLCLPEITTMLFISYMPIQNVFGVKKNFLRGCVFSRYLLLKICLPGPS